MTGNELTNFLQQPDDFSFTQDVDTRVGVQNGSKVIKQKSSVYVLEGVEDPPDPFLYETGGMVYKFMDIDETDDGQYIAQKMVIQ